MWLIANQPTVQLKAHPNSHRPVSRQLQREEEKRHRHIIRRKTSIRIKKTLTSSITMLAKVTATAASTCLRRTCTAVLRHHLPRSLSVQAAAAESSMRTNEDLVKAAVHKMMLEQQQQQSSSTAGVTEEALQKASYCLRVSYDGSSFVFVDALARQSLSSRVSHLASVPLFLNLNQ